MIVVLLLVALILALIDEAWAGVLAALVIGIVLAGLAWGRL